MAFFPVVNYDKQNGYELVPALIFDTAQTWLVGQGDDGSLGVLYKHAQVAAWGEDTNGIVICTRFRVPTATVNAGATLLPAISGLKYRIISCKAIAIGGAAASNTAVLVRGTQAASAVTLFSYAQASLTQSTVLMEGIAGTTVLADGASFIQNDVNTAVTIANSGSAMTGATNIDIIITYVLGQ